MIRWLPYIDQFSTQLKSVLVEVLYKYRKYFFDALNTENKSFELAVIVIGMEYIHFHFLVTWTSMDVLSIGNFG